MKRTVTIIFLMLTVWLSATQAQAPAKTLQQVDIQFWPDYDQASVLVLFTGTFASDTQLPIEVTIPLPPNAQINAVARIDSDNRMIDDVIYNTTDNSLTLTAPTSRFRVEYYFPYATTGDQHHFDYDWQANLNIEQFSIIVQQPLAADELTTEPTAVNSFIDDQDAFTYHTIPTQAVAANQQLTVQVNYPMPTPQLSVDMLENGEEIGDEEIASSNDSNASIFFILAGISGIVAVGLFIWQRNGRGNKNKRIRKPQPQRTKKKRHSTKYCHQCGTKTISGDTYCRHCGTQLKT